MGFSSAPVFPARKREAIIHEELARGITLPGSIQKYYIVGGVWRTGKTGKHGKVGVKRKG